MSDVFGDYLRSISRIPMLAHQEEVHCGRLVRLWLDAQASGVAVDTATVRRGRRALERMVTANLRLVVSVVTRFRRLGRQYRLEPIDLVQAGNLGLIRAAERFDPSRGYRFSTFAYWWIRQAVTRHLQEQGAAIRLPHALRLLAQRYHALQERSATALSIEAAAGRLGEAPQRLLQAIRAHECSRTLSLDQAMGDGDQQDLTLLDTVAGADQPAVMDDYAWLEGPLRQLSPQERDVLRSRFCEQPVSLMRLAQRLGKSRYQVQAVERRAVRRLRQLVTPMLEP